MDFSLPVATAWQILLLANQDWKRILDFKIKNISNQLDKVSFMLLSYHSTKVLLK